MQTILFPKPVLPSSKKVKSSSFNTHKPIPGITHLRLPKSLRNTHTLETLQNCVKQLVSFGMSVKECDFYGENFEDEKSSKRVLKILLLMEENLIAAEYPDGMPRPVQEVLNHLVNRKTSKTAIVLQRKDGTYPRISSEKYGSGVLFIGDKDPAEQ